MLTWGVSLENWVNEVSRTGINCISTDQENGYYLPHLTIYSLSLTTYCGMTYFFLSACIFSHNVSHIPWWSGNFFIAFSSAFTLIEPVDNSKQFYNDE